MPLDLKAHMLKQLKDELKDRVFATVRRTIDTARKEDNLTKVIRNVALVSLGVMEHPNPLANAIQRGSGEALLGVILDTLTHDYLTTPELRLEFANKMLINLESGLREIDKSKQESDNGKDG